VDPLTQIKLTRELVDIESTTGKEAEAGRKLAGILHARGYHVVTQPVLGDRFNVVATLGAAPPRVVFSTHFDCVPPFFPSREADGLLYGRGACDAKGIAVAQIAAAERLRAEGESRLGLLFVVGEERGSEGAKAANTLSTGATKFLINGEPTDNRLGVATRGVYRVKLTASGRAAHTSRPELGESAIEKLLDALVALRRIDWPDDPTLGRTHYTVGLIDGGVAPNVVPAHAEAEIMFRTIGDYRAIRERLELHTSPLVSLDDVLVVPPVTLQTLPGFASEVFAFTTDIPWLDRWGAPLLLGPGSIAVAHTETEHVAIRELHAAVDLYASIARTLLSSNG
jgi:acetylornithine deacetylase